MADSVDADAKTDAKQAEAAGSVIFLLVVIVICGLLAVRGCNTSSFPTSSSPATKPQPEDKYGAIVAAEGFVRDRLKSPGSAVFPLDMDVSRGAGGGWVVKGYVDSQNSFGGLARTNFTAKLHESTDLSKWILDDISMLQR